MSLYTVGTLFRKGRRIKKIPIYQLQVTLKESAHSRCWLFKNSILINCTTTYQKISSHYQKMNRKCIKVAKTNNYKGLCIRHTFVKRELNIVNCFSIERGADYFNGLAQTSHEYCGIPLEQIEDAMEQCFTLQKATEFIVFYLYARLGTGNFTVQNLSGIGNAGLWYL